MVPKFIKRKIPLTIFGVGLALQKNLEICKAIKDSNFEIASHGYRWIDYQYIDPEGALDSCNNLLANRPVQVFCFSILVSSLN